MAASTTRSLHPIEANALLRQIIDRGTGTTIVAVEAQVVGGHRVQDDQENIGSTRRRKGPFVGSLRLDLVRAEEVCRQDRYQKGGDRKADPDESSKDRSTPLECRYQAGRRSRAAKEEPCEAPVYPGKCRPDRWQQCKPAQRLRAASHWPRCPERSRTIDRAKPTSRKTPRLMSGISQTKCRLIQ